MLNSVNVSILCLNSSFQQWLLGTPLLYLSKPKLITLLFLSVLVCYVTICQCTGWEYQCVYSMLDLSFTGSCNCQSSILAGLSTNRIFIVAKTKTFFFRQAREKQKPRRKQLWFCDMTSNSKKDTHLCMERINSASHSSSNEGDSLQLRGKNLF